MLFASCLQAVTQDLIWRVPHGGSLPAWGTIRGEGIASNVDLPGTKATVGSQQIVTSASNASTAMEVVRGFVSAAGTAVDGEGYSSAYNSGTHVYTITFDNAFVTGGKPVITASPYNSLGGSTGYAVTISNATATGFTYEVGTAGSPVASDVMFIVMGLRAS